MEQTKTNQTNQTLTALEREILLEKKHDAETELYAKSVFLNEYGGTGDYFSDSFIAKIESDAALLRSRISSYEAKLKLRGA